MKLSKGKIVKVHRRVGKNPSAKTFQIWIVSIELC